MATIPAYLGKHALEGVDLHKATPEQLATGLTYSTSDWIKKDRDYVLVGEAEITVTLHKRESIVKNQVAALRQQQKAVVAAAQQESTRIEKQINSLLAIEGAATEVSA